MQHPESFWEAGVVPVFVFFSSHCVRKRGIFVWNMLWSFVVSVFRQIRLSAVVHDDSCVCGRPCWKTWISKGWWSWFCTGCVKLRNKSPAWLEDSMPSRVQSLWSLPADDHVSPPLIRLCLSCASPSRRIKVSVTQIPLICSSGWKS